MARGMETLTQFGFTARGQRQQGGASPGEIRTTARGHSLSSLWPLLIAIVCADASVGLWLSFGVYAGKLNNDLILVALSQGIFTGLVVSVWLSSSEWKNRGEGWGLITALAMHVLMMYGIANIGPVIFPDLVFLTNFAPSSSFALATLAAALLFCGTVIGVYLVRPSRAQPPAGRGQDISMAWLPSYTHSILFAFILAGMMGFATAKYGALWAIVLNAGGATELPIPFWDGLILYSFLISEPLAPTLAAAALCRAENGKQRRVAIFVLLICLILSVVSLSVWRMRVWAILCLVLPLLLLVRAQFLRSWTVLLGVALGGILIYSVVTQVRNSELVNLFASEGGLGGITLEQALRAAVQPNSVDYSVSSTFLLDISYNRAGLDAPAAVLWQQWNNRAALGWGRVTATEWLSFLPSAIRPEWATSQTAEAAAVQSGAVQPVDQVESILLGLVLDFGWWGLFFPSILFGMLLGTIDKGLVRMSSLPHWEWVKVYRFAWLLQIVFANSTAWPLVNFIKVSIGLALFLAAGNALLSLTKSHSGQASSGIIPTDIR